MGQSRLPHTHHITAAMLAFGLAQGGGNVAQAQDVPLQPESAQTVTGEENAVGQATAPVVTAAAPQTQTTTSYHLDPLMPVPLIAGMAALYAALGIYPFRRRIKGAALRAFAGASVAVLLLNPESAQENRQILPTEVLVIVDGSASQRFGERAAQTDEGYRQLVENLSGLENVNIRTIEIDGRAADGSLQDGTQLFAAIREGMADIPRDQLGGIVVLTDGLVHDVPERFVAADVDIPIHAYITGHEGEYDRRIEIVNAPSFGLPDSEQTVQLRFTNQGDMDSAPATITVSVNGDVFQDYTAAPNEIIDVTLPIELTGANVYDFSVETVEGELTDVNNTISTEIEGVQEELNVLMVSGSPGQSTRALRDVLKADAGVNIVHLTLLRDLSQPQNVPLREVALIPFPAYEIFIEKINEFDLIILDRARIGNIRSHHLRSIREYVEQGGALMMINSDEYANPRETLGNTSIMADALAIAPQENGFSQGAYRPRAEDDGRRHPITRGLPNAGAGEGQESWGAWLNHVAGQAHDDAHVLLYGPADEPLLAVRRVGEGRVASLMSDNVFLWDRGYDGGGPSAVLLQRMAHWLMAYPALEEEDLRLTLSEDGQTLIVTRQTMAEDFEAPAILISPSGEEIEVPLEQTDNGLYQGQISVQELGFYRARQGRDTDGASVGDAEERDAPTLQSFVSVGPSNPLEFQDTISTMARLAAVMEDRAGTVTRLAGEAENDNDARPGVSVPAFRLASANAARENFTDAAAPAIRETNSFILTDVTDKPLIPGWLGMMTALALFGGAWYREGGGKGFPLRRNKGGAQATPKA